MKSIVLFFDKLEDRIRRRLSYVPIFYALIGGVGIVLFWRGVWHTADELMHQFLHTQIQYDSLHPPGLPWWDGPLSLIIGSILLLMTGVFVSNFIGNEIILSGLRGEKKLAEKTVDELKTETGAIADIQMKIQKISDQLTHFSPPKKPKTKKTT